MARSLAKAAGLAGGPVPPAHPAHRGGALFLLSGGEITRLVATRDVSAAKVVDAHLQTSWLVDRSIDSWQPHHGARTSFLPSWATWKKRCATDLTTPAVLPAPVRN